MILIKQKFVIPDFIDPKVLLVSLIDGKIKIC